MYWPHTCLNPDHCSPQPPTLTAFAPHRLRKVYEKAKGTSPKEYTYVKNSTYMHQPSGMTRVFDVIDSAQLLQLPEALIESLQLYASCDEVIWDETCNAVKLHARPPLHPLTAKSTTPFQIFPLPGMLRCGEHVLCNKCSVVVEMLGKSWHYRKAVALILAQLQHAPVTLATASPAFHIPPHKCSPKCLKIQYAPPKRARQGPQVSHPSAAEVRQQARGPSISK